MKVRRCTRLTGGDGGGGGLRCFDTSRLQRLALIDDDTGSLLVTSTPEPLEQSGPADDAKPPSSLMPSVFFVERRLRPLIFVLFSMIPSLAFVAAFSTWTYTSVQVPPLTCFLIVNQWLSRDFRLLSG